MSAETRDRLAEILLAHGPMADTTATSARTLEQIDHNVSESLSAIHALDAQVQQESPDNAAIRDGMCGQTTARASLARTALTHLSSLHALAALGS